MAKKTRRSYAELDNILGRHYADNNFCALVAICIATDASVGKVKRYVEKFAKTWEGRKRVHRRGTPFEVIKSSLNRFGKEHDQTGISTATVGIHLTESTRNLH